MFFSQLQQVAKNTLFLQSHNISHHCHLSLEQSPLPSNWSELATVTIKNIGSTSQCPLPKKEGLVSCVYMLCPAAPNTQYAVTLLDNTIVVQSCYSILSPDTLQHCVKIAKTVLKVVTKSQDIFLLLQNCENENSSTILPSKCEHLATDISNNI